MNASAASARAGSTLGVLFRSLRHRNFRLFFIGQGISLIGTWMQMVAVGWLIWRLRHDPLMLGLVGFAGRIPTFALAPFAGVLVDRWDRHRTIIVTQVLAMVQALLLAGLMLSGLIEQSGIAGVWIVLGLSLVLGLVNALDVPARQSFMVQLLDRPEDLNNAIALNSSMVNGARLIGPTIAGLLIAAVGEGVCFLLNGLSYIAVIAGLMMMRVRPNPRLAPHTRILHNLKEGLVYAFGFAPIRAILLLLALVSLMGQSYVQLLPIFAERILHGDARTQGFLVSAAGVGALAGAVYLAMRRSVRGLGRLIALAPAVFGIGLLGLAASSALWLSLAVLPVVGFGLLVQLASSNTVIQTIVEDDKRGRVMGFYSMAFMGMVPLGSLLAGWLASQLGAPRTVAIGGVCCILGSVAFSTKLPALRRLVHPIYVKKGIIIPEVAAGLAAAAETPPPPPARA